MQKGDGLMLAALRWPYEPDALEAREAADDPLDPVMNATRELGDVLMIAFKSIQSVDNGDIDRPLFWPRRTAECRGLEKLLLFLLPKSSTVDRRECAVEGGRLISEYIPRRRNSAGTICGIGRIGSAFIALFLRSKSTVVPTLLLLLIDDEASPSVFMLLCGRESISLHEDGRLRIHGMTDTSDMAGESAT